MATTNDSSEPRLRELEPKNPPLHPVTQQRVRAVKLGLALDTWAVLVAVVLALLIRFNVLPAIAWFK
jgi:hypothetical protein